MNDKEKNGLMKQRRLAREKYNKLQSNWDNLEQELEKWLEQIKINSYENGVKYENVMQFYVGIKETINKIKEIKMNELEGVDNDIFKTN